MDLWIEKHSLLSVFEKTPTSLSLVNIIRSAWAASMAHADDDAALRRLLCVDGQVQLQEPVTSTGGKRQEDWHGAKVKGGSVVVTSYGLLQLGGTSRYSNLVPADVGTKI